MVRFTNHQTLNTIINCRENSIMEHPLNLAPESPLEPAMPIIDPHHHLIFSKNNKYTSNDYLIDIGGGHNIVKSVFIEVWGMYNHQNEDKHRPWKETEWVVADTTNSSISRTEVAAGIVGYADFLNGEKVDETLESHANAGKGRFRGIRVVTAWDPDPVIPSSPEINSSGFLSDPKFRSGFSRLQKYNLSFDAMLYYHQFDELVALAKDFPGTTLIVNHMGIPLGIGPYENKRNEVFLDWKREISKLVPFKNIYIKLGGLGMDICGFGWSRNRSSPASAEVADTVKPYYMFCIEKCGVNRCMFESNFPADKQSYSYNILWNSVKLMTQDLSVTERSALFYDTAATVYRI